MVSYVVCLYRQDVFERVCAPALQRQVERYGAEVVLVRSGRGICHAYEQGRKVATHPTIAYIHDDIELQDDDASERIVRYMDRAGAALMGVVGSAAGRKEIPWWTARDKVGAWCWLTRKGEKRWQPGKQGAQAMPFAGQRTVPEIQPAAMLDGIVLCDRTNAPWPSMDGWHGYDVDRSALAAQYGPVIVADLSVAHHNQGHSEEWTRALDPIMATMRGKWGLE